MAATSWKRAGNSEVRAARETVTVPDSSGSRRTSLLDEIQQIAHGRTVGFDAARSMVARWPTPIEVGSQHLLLQRPLLAAEDMRRTSWRDGSGRCLRSAWFGGLARDGCAHGATRGVGLGRLSACGLPTSREWQDAAVHARPLFSNTDCRDVEAGRAGRRRSKVGVFMTPPWGARAFQDGGANFLHVFARPWEPCVGTSLDEGFRMDACVPFSRYFVLKINDLRSLAPRSPSGP